MMVLWLIVMGCQGQRTCEATCNKLYAEEECHIERPGRTMDDLLSECVNYCTTAWNARCEKDCRTGCVENTSLTDEEKAECKKGCEEKCGVGQYDPYTNEGSSSSVTLDSRAQAELWAECVAEQPCDKIYDGYCAPVW